MTTQSAPQNAPAALRLPPLSLPMKNTVALTVRHEVWMTPATPGQILTR